MVLIWAWTCCICIRVYFIVYSRERASAFHYGRSWNEICSSVYIISVHYHLIAIVYLMIGLPFSFETEQMNNNVGLSAIGIGLGMYLLHLY